MSAKLEWLKFRSIIGVEFDVATLVRAYLYFGEHPVEWFLVMLKWNKEANDRQQWREMCCQCIQVWPASCPWETWTLFTFHHETEFEPWINRSSQQRLWGNKWQCESKREKDRTVGIHNGQKESSSKRERNHEGSEYIILMRSFHFTDLGHIKKEHRTYFKIFLIQ